LFFNRVWSLDIEDYSPCSQSEMPDMGWINLVKCSFGMFERRSLLPCGSCMVKYYDYGELPASCDCCSQSNSN
ncbi:hypothetical protein GOODEAATRI_034094, partial [Goodea atripinnis]